jgi:hypothetical protein
MLGRLATLAIVAALVASAASAQTTSSSGSAAGAACGCPQIKPVATDDKPDPRHIHNEMTLADLEGYFSNREALYDGDWEKAMLALAHDIDPSGQMQISTGAAPPPKRQLAIKEGGISYYLLHEAPSLPQRSGVVSPGQRSENDSGLVMSRIVATLARINKYGEPQFGLRKALMATARFMARNLTNVPLEQANAAPRGTAARALSIGRTAHGVIGTRLYMAALFAYGAYADSLAKQTEAASKAGELPPPDPFDIANAALDIVLSLDDKSQRSGLGYRGLMTRGLVQTGLSAASLRAVFNASAASGLPSAPVYQHWKANFGDKGGPADAVGCKAFSILAMLASFDAKDGVKYRNDLRTAMSGLAGDIWEYRLNPNQPGGGGFPHKYAHSIFVAGRALLIVAGMTEEDDPRNSARGMFEAADHNWSLMGSGGEAARGAFDDTLVTIRDYEGYLRGPGKADFLKGMQEFLTEFRSWLDPKSGAYYRGESGERFMAAWEASKPDWNPVIAEPLCKPPAAPPRVFLMAKGEFGRLLVDKFYQGIPLMVGVYFEEPYDQDSYDVTVNVGGGTLSLKAVPSDSERRVFQTEPFVVSP